MNKTYSSKFKVSDIVKYDGKIRLGCTHNNEEYAKVLSCPNSSRPYYLVGVLDIDGTPLRQIIYYIDHPINFLIDEDDLCLVKED